MFGPVLKLEWLSVHQRRFDDMSGGVWPLDSVKVSVYLQNLVQNS